MQPFALVSGCVFFTECKMWQFQALKKLHMGVFLAAIFAGGMCNVVFWFITNFIEAVCITNKTKHIRLCVIVNLS